MGHKNTNHASDLLALELNNVGIDGIAQPSKLGGVLYMSLHSADPGASGNQESSEADYFGYERVPIERSASVPKWTVANGRATNKDTIEFPICEGGSSVVTWFGLGTNKNGAGRLLRRGKIEGGGFTVSNNITPQAKPGTITIEES